MINFSKYLMVLYVEPNIYSPLLQVFHLFLTFKVFPTNIHFQHKEDMFLNNILKFYSSLKHRLYHSKQQQSYWINHLYLGLHFHFLKVYSGVFMSNSSHMSYDLNQIKVFQVFLLYPLLMIKHMKTQLRIFHNLSSSKKA